MVALFLALASAASTAPVFHAELRDYLEGVGRLDRAELAFAQSYGALMDKQSLRAWLQYYNMPASAADLGPTYQQMDADANGLSFAELVAEMELREQVLAGIGLMSMPLPKGYPCWKEHFPDIFPTTTDTRAGKKVNKAQLSIDFKRGLKVNVANAIASEATLLVSAYERYVDWPNMARLKKQNDQKVIGTAEQMLRAVDWGVTTLKNRVDQLTEAAKAKNERAPPVARALAVLIRLAVYGVQTEAVGREQLTKAAVGEDWATKIDLPPLEDDWEQVFLHWWCSSNFQTVFSEASQNGIWGDSPLRTSQVVVENDKACAALKAQAEAKKAAAAKEKKLQDAQNKKHEFESGKTEAQVELTVPPTKKLGFTYKKLDVYNGDPHLNDPEGILGKKPSEYGGSLALKRWKTKVDKILPADIGSLTVGPWTITWLEASDSGDDAVTTEVDPTSDSMRGKAYRIIKAGDTAIENRQALKDWKARQQLKAGNTITLTIKIFTLSALASGP